MTPKNRRSSFAVSKRKPVTLGPLVIIVCEGKETEIDYFNFWAKKLGKRVRFIIEQSEFGTNPKSLVSSAIKLQEENALDNPSVWCIGDRDEFSLQDLNDSQIKARAKGIQYVLSVPCLEVWFILHYEQFNKSVHRHKAQSYSKTKLPRSIPNQGPKNLNQTQLEDLDRLHMTAIANAKWLENSNRTAGKTFPQDPSSNLYQLIEFLNAL